MAGEDGRDETDAVWDLDAWEAAFREAAEADGGVIFRDHLRRLNLPDDPDGLLEGTINFVRKWNGFSSLDSEDFGRLLEMQTYDPALSEEARYAYTFDINGYAYARVLLDTKYQNLDLADMYEALWYQYQTCGYETIQISHLDWSPLTAEEKALLEEEVTNDLRFDNSEEELNFWFIDENPDYLYVQLQEVHETDNDDEAENEE